MNYRSNAEIDRLLSLVQNHEFNASFAAEVEKTFSTCRNSSLLDVFKSLSSDSLNSILTALKDRFVSCCKLCLTSPKSKRGLLLKVRFFDTTFLCGLFLALKIDCGSDEANGLFVNIFADGVFNECLRFVRNCCDADPTSGESRLENVRALDGQPNALIGIAGGTLGLCINRLVKLKRNARSNPKKAVLYQDGLNFASHFRMSSKEKLEMLRTQSDSHLRFLFYRDRGFLHIPKLQMLPLIRKINDEVRYHFSNDIFTATCSKTLQHIWCEMNEKSDELFQEFVELAVQFSGRTVDEHVARLVFRMFLSKFCHASMNEQFRNMKIFAFEKTGKRSHGGISLREKLYASTTRGQ